MKQEIRDRWTAALRSGEYEQGRSTLRDREDRYCCLGVLCDVLGKDVPQGDFRDPGPDHLYDLVAELLGDDLITRLSFHNDAGESFPWIADYIEGRTEVEP